MHVGRLDYSAGGVGRNICEALGKLGRSSHFISAVGDDQQGRILTRNIPKESSKLIKVFPGRHSAQCIVVLDRNGNCSFLMGDMSIHELITPEVIEQHENIIKKSPLIVLDGNISEAGMAKALEVAHTHNIPVFYEPTDISIAQKPFKTNNWKAIKFITPNLEELNHIYHFLKEDKLKRHNDKNDDPVKVIKYVASVIDNVIVTLGEKGILIARKGLATEPFLLSNESDRISVRHYPVKARTDIVNVSGAGDCFASGLITAFLENLPEETCVSVGFAAAVSALYSQSAVPTEIFTRSHRSWKEKAEYNTL